MIGILWAITIALIGFGLAAMMSAETTRKYKIGVSALIVGLLLLILTIGLWLLTHDLTL